MKRYAGTWRSIPWREHSGYLTPQPLQKRVWIHTVSIGEAAAACALTKWFEQQGYALLLTYTTKQGGEWLRAHHPQATVAALPLDYPPAVRRFIKRGRPSLGVILEAEMLA